MAQSGGGFGAILPILLIGGAAYLVWNYFSAASAAATPAPTPTPTPTPAPAPTPAPVESMPITPPQVAPAAGAPVLTVADAASYPYSSSIPAATIQALNPQLATNLAGGQIPMIAGNSVLAYMLGWGGQAAGATETTAAATGGNEKYTFDGTNWNYVGTGVSGLFGLGLPRAPRIPRVVRFQPVGKNYVRPGSPMRVGR